MRSRGIKWGFWNVVGLSLLLLSNVPNVKSEIDGQDLSAVEASVRLKAHLTQLKQEALKDPSVKATVNRTLEIRNEAKKVMAARMKQLDPSIAPLLESGVKYGPEDRERLARLKKQALEDPDVKTAYEKYELARVQADQKLHQKMKELDPSMVAIIDQIEKELSKPVKTKSSEN